MVELLLTADIVYMASLGVAVLVALLNGVGLCFVMKKLSVCEESISYDNVYPSGTNSGPVRTPNKSAPLPGKSVKSTKSVEAKSAIEPNKKEYDEAAAKVAKK